MSRKAFPLFVALSVLSAGAGSPLEWSELNARTCPSWWTEAKFGVFIHWGVYSVPAYAPPHADPVWHCYAEQYSNFLDRMKLPHFIDYHAKHHPGKSYRDFADDFTAEHFDPAAWADLFRRAGAKYVVLTSKHHDGFALWPSAHAQWSVGKAGPKRDLCGDLSRAVRDAGLHMGFYFSLLEFFHPLYDTKTIDRYVAEVNLPQLKELVTNYRPDVVWTDGEWDYPESVHRGREFLTWLYRESPVADRVVANDRWGKGFRGKCGDHWTTEYGEVTQGETMGEAAHPWEECRGLGRSFGYNRCETAEDYMSAKACVELLADTVSRGGNLLLNIGPRADGIIPPIMAERLLALGAWLKVNGEAVYGSRRGTLASDGKGLFFTDGKTARYAIDCRLNGRPFVVRNAGAVRSVSLVGSEAKVGFSVRDGALTIVPPALAPAEAPCEHAWVYRIVEGDVDASAEWVSVFNQDSTNFMITHGDEKMNAAGIREYLDSVIGHGAFTHFFICPNAQTAIFDSKTMSPSWWRLTAKGKYQIRLGNDFLQSADCPRREYLLHTNGVDIIQVYIDGCREKGVSPWLSMRMNDGHVPENPQWWGHSQFWVDHPEYRREGGFDFSHPEVRAYHLAFVRELLERYDVDGFECDWMRWPFRQRTEDLTEMMREIRKIVKTAAHRRGHTILVGARVSSRPDAARAHAMDVVAWAKEGLVDWVVPCNFFSSADFELPLDEWKRLLAGSKVRVIPGTDTGVRIGDPVTKKVTIDRRLLTLAEYREWADRMQRKGADGLYFFNLFTYHEPAYHATTTEPWDVIVREGLSPQAIRGKAKSFPQGWIYEP